MAIFPWEEEYSQKHGQITIEGRIEYVAAFFLDFKINSPWEELVAEAIRRSEGRSSMRPLEAQQKATRSCVCYNGGMSHCDCVYCSCVGLPNCSHSETQRKEFLTQSLAEVLVAAKIAEFDLGQINFSQIISKVSAHSYYKEILEWDC